MCINTIKGWFTIFDTYYVTTGSHFFQWDLIVMQENMMASRLQHKGAAQTVKHMKSVLH